MIRLFVGLALPAALRQRLASLGSGLPGAHWVPEENLHVTLRFIGEVDELQGERIHDNLLGLRGEVFPLVVRGCGAFSSGHRTHTLWLGVEPSPPLLHLQDKIESAVVRAGQPPERRKYQPHITLARLKNPPVGRLQEFIAGHNLLRETVPADHFVLFSSQLGQGDPVYTAEMAYPLGGNGFPMAFAVG